MNAKVFAKMFIEDLQEDIKTASKDESYCFSLKVYKDDPELKILKAELKKAGYDLELVDKTEKLTDQSWKIVKL